MNDLKQLIDDFTKEAKAAPVLFADLSKVEEYIAETYKNRSFIELIQNADDAGSTSFGIHKTSFGIVICNNGRVFTSEDIESLCRSGSSNKKRGNDTIGYRGIGFKSVVGLAKEIDLLSGAYQLGFNKFKTMSLLNVMTAPTIRIPHPIVVNNENLKEITQLKEKYGYTTFFIFKEVDETILFSELSRFNYSCLLFLNHILNVTIEVELLCSHINLNRAQISESQVDIAIRKNEVLVADWRLFQSLKNFKDIVAFKMSENEIIAAEGSESVVHSFMPSTEFSGAFLKINGDFSTDPSRKSVDIDTFSEIAIDNCTLTVYNLIKDVLLQKSRMIGIFRPFLNTHTETQSSIGRLFTTKLREQIQSSAELDLNGFRLCPKWLPYEDYELLSKGNFNKLSRNLILDYPECVNYLESLGVRTLTLKETLGLINHVFVSKVAAAQILSKVISQYHFDMTPDNIKYLQSLKLFPIKKNEGFFPVLELSVISEIDNRFMNIIYKSNELSEITIFFEKLGIMMPTDKLQEVDTVNLQLSEDMCESSIFVGSPKIQRWRSGEQNLVEYLKCLRNVDKVQDVAIANLGYDILVQFNTGRQAYIEVKNVSYFGEPIKMTNNEYTTAHTYQSDYYLALVMNTADFQVRFIPNPVLNIQLNKQCEKWSWVCTELKDKTITTDVFTQVNL